jgi:ABC-type branched-subunit amino acid transport system substrate-binding protein
LEPVTLPAIRGGVLPRIRLTALFVTPLIVATLSSFVAACSSSSKTPASGGSSSSGSSTTVALQGAPVKIGFVDIEGDLGIDFSPQRNAATQLVDYLNGRGGIGSHPIKLISCITKAASGGADCANRMVQDKVAIVLSFSTIDTAPMYPILKSAGIPVLGSGNSPLNAADLTPDGNHFFTTAGALVRYATSNPFIVHTLKAKSVGLLVGSSSAAQQAADKFIKAPLEAMGVKVEIAQVAESNPDYTAAVNAVANTDVLQVLVDCSGQDAAIKQAVALGYKGKIFGCDDPADLQAMGSAAAGVYAPAPLKPATDPAFANDADVKAFLAVADKYGWAKSVITETVYSLVLAARDAIIKAGGPTATGVQVAQVLRSTSKAPLALGSDAGITCSRVLSNFAPTSCNVDVIFTQVQADGHTVKAVGTFVPPPSS